jgi:hypothetical protein
MSTFMFPVNVSLSFDLLNGCVTDSELTAQSPNQRGLLICPNSPTLVEQESSPFLIRLRFSVRLKPFKLRHLRSSAACHPPPL